MKLRILTILAIGLAYTSPGQEAAQFHPVATVNSSQATDSIQFRKISNEIMLHGACYENLRVLCKTIGHRISGSPAAAKAVAWGEQAMKDAGADKVWL